MTVPSITAANIRVHAPIVVRTLGLYSLYPGGNTLYGDIPESERSDQILNRGNQILDRLNPHLEKLSSPDGMNCNHFSHPSKIHIGWNYNTDNRINGLFVSIYQEQPNVKLEAYKIVTRYSGSEYLEVRPFEQPAFPDQNHPTVIHRNITEDKDFLRRLFIMSIFSEGSLAYEGELPFNAQWLDHEEVRAFYDKHPGILDNLLHQQPTPSQPNSPEPSDTNMRKYCLIVGASLLFIVVAYFATEYFTDSESSKA